MIDFDSAPGGSAAADSQHYVYLDALNDKQREAVLITEGPLIVLAGAGSGKTKMLTTRISHLIHAHHVSAYQILAVTFTNKAAGEMRDRVHKTLAEAGGGHLGAPEIGTFHSVCVRLLRRELGFLPFTKPFVIYDDSDQLSMIKQVMNKLGIEEKSISPKGIQSSINRAKCDAIESKEMDPAAHNFFERQLKRIYEQYEKDMITNNALDFGEIICATYRLLRDNLPVRQKYQRRWRYLHVDEYQDTNRSQYLLLSMLAKPQFGGHQNICVVGDEDQSIYKWRGADIGNILDFERDYPSTQVVKLEQNYRSTKTIIHAAGEVIKNNLSRKDKTLWTDNTQGEAIIRAQLPDERMEAELAVSEIKRLAALEGRVFGDFAIFYRTNAQSRQFEDVLRREKIPYQIVGGLRFYDRKEIKDVLSYFKAILNPSDSISLKRIINVPGRGIGKTSLEKIDEYIAMKKDDKLTYWDALVQFTNDPSLSSAATAKKLGGFVQLMNRLFFEQPNLMLSELYHLILDETGYVRELRKEGTDEALARIENLEEFDTLLQEFDEDNFVSVEDPEKQPKKAELLPIFIEQSSLASGGDQLDEGASTVKMMTLHSSKGLEFPVVFLVGMEEGLFPSFKPWEETQNEDIEEERRLCYVGMTRARERLYCLHAAMRRLWGDVKFGEPSRFFDEMPKHMVDFRDFSGRNAQTVPGSAMRKRQEYDDVAQESYSDDVPAAPALKPSTRILPFPPRGAVAAIGGQSNDLIGRRLAHAEYGNGKIIATDGSGSDQKVTVNFGRGQQRKFLLRYVASYLE